MTEQHDIRPGAPEDPRELGTPGRSQEAHERVTAARLRREERTRARRQRNATRAIRLTALLALIALVAAAGIVGWQTPEINEYVIARLAASSAEEASASDASANVPVVYEEYAVDSDIEGDPTALFASYRSMYLYLPVDGGQLTEIAFHQASGDHALHMEPLVPYADMSDAVKNHGSGRSIEDSCCPDNPHILGGQALRMYRSNRTGPPDTAVDIGADPGTPVYAPVSGTVLEVRPYWLYGEHEDYEIHITPNGWPEVDVVLIHVDNVVVAKGDEVVGGVTQIAEIRGLSGQVALQLAQFDEHGGNHTHMQLNRLDVPGILPEPDGS